MAPKQQYQELWAEAGDGQLMCALINGENGWLMYLPDEESAGYHSYSSAYQGDESAQMEFLLSNGQMDFYPLSWVLPLAQVQQALAYFKAEKKPPNFILWQDDAGNGLPKP